MHERRGIEFYRSLLALCEGRSITLEEFARQKIRNEEMHVAEIEKCYGGGETRSQAELQSVRTGVMDDFERFRAKLHEGATATPRLTFC